MCVLVRVDASNHGAVDSPRFILHDTPGNDFRNGR